MRFMASTGETTLAGGAGAKGAASGVGVEAGASEAAACPSALSSLCTASVIDLSSLSASAIDVSRLSIGS